MPTAATWASTPAATATFPADADGIVPITDTDWFDDDAAHRVVEFICVAGTRPISKRT